MAMADGANTSIGLVHFHFSPIPAGSSIKDAEIFFVEDGSGFGPVWLKVFRARQTWTESETWNSFDQLQVDSAGVQEVDGPYSGDFWRFRGQQLVNYVDEYVNDPPASGELAIRGLALLSLDRGLRFFRTRENAISGFRPRLVIDYTPPQFGLSVNRSGAGTVTSSPSGISCGSDCSESYSSGTSVTLTATPDAGWTFDGWSGSGCTGTGTCTVSMTRARSVSASFSIPPAQFQVSVIRSGAGTVTSSPSGISCGSDCSQSYSSGTSVTLTASPASGWAFDGWNGGACAGQGDCTVMSSTTVAAMFVEVFCGDGVVNSPEEECDDGNNVGGDGCSASCIDEMCGGLIAELGDNLDRLGLDRDVFEFLGAAGESVDVSLDSTPSGSQAGTVSWLVVDDAGGQAIFEPDSGALPRSVSVSLPRSGRYLVVVNADSRYQPGDPHRGKYCIELNSSAVASSSLEATQWTE